MALNNPQITNQSIMTNKRNRSSFEGSDASDTNDNMGHWAKTSYSFGDSFGFTEFTTSPARGEKDEIDGSSFHGKIHGEEDPMITVPSLSLIQHTLNQPNEDEEEEDYNEAELQPLFDKIQGVLQPKSTGPPPPRTFRVLIIDDSMVQRKICRVLLAVDGQSAFSSSSSPTKASVRPSSASTILLTTSTTSSSSTTTTSSIAQPKTTTTSSSSSSSSSAKENDDSLPSLKRPHDTWLVQTAESGEHALQIFATTTPVTPGQPPFDVIIVDQNMSSAGGAMLGHQVVERIRSMPLFRRTVIIGCSAYAEEAGKLLYGAGCDAVWSKPMPTKDIIHQEMLSLIDVIPNHLFSPSLSLSLSAIDIIHQEMLSLIDVRLQRIRWFNASSLIATVDDDDADDVHEDGNNEEQPTTTTATTTIATTTATTTTAAATKKSPASGGKNRRQASAPAPAVAPGKEEGEGKNLDVTMRRKRQRT